MIGTNWDIDTLKLSDLNKELGQELKRLDREEKQAQLQKRLCTVGIVLVLSGVGLALSVVINHHFKHGLQRIAHAADEQLVISDGKTVLVVPDLRYGDTFTYPVAKKKNR